MSKAHFSSTIFPFAEQAASRERARIRRLIGPALRMLTVSHGPLVPSCVCVYCEAIKSIHAATRPESKRKVKK